MNIAVNCETSDVTYIAGECLTVGPDSPSYTKKKKLDEYFSEGSNPSEPVFDDAQINSPFTQPSITKNASGAESPALSAWLYPSIRLVGMSKENVPNSSRSPKGTRRKLTKFSDWGDVYYGYDSRQSSNHGTITPTTDFTSLSDHVSAMESCLPRLPSQPKKLTIPPGKVLGMFLGKQKYRPKMLNLEATVVEVVNLFLSVENGAKLPVSVTETVHKRPIVMNERRMAMTLADILGSKFDAERSGLTFSIGLVNSIHCYKMTVCELSKMEMILSLFCADCIFPLD